MSITASLHSSPPLSLFFQKHRERRRSSTASNGFPGNANLFAGNANLPDLVQQSTSPLVSPGDASGAQVGGAAPNCRPPETRLYLILIDPITCFPRSPCHTHPAYKPVTNQLFGSLPGREITSSHQPAIKQ